MNFKPTDLFICNPNLPSVQLFTLKPIDNPTVPTIQCGIPKLGPGKVDVVLFLLKDFKKYPSLSPLDLESSTSSFLISKYELLQTPSFNQLLVIFSLTKKK